MSVRGGCVLKRLPDTNASIGLYASQRCVLKKERKRIYIAPLLKYLTLKALRYGSHTYYTTCVDQIADTI